VQFCQFRENWGEAVKRGVEIFGVNPRRTESHAKFRAKHQFPFPLLVDKGQKVARLYHANGLIVVRRTVYLIGPDGAIRFAQRGMPAPAEVLAAAPAL
jgi:peroxiredoxin Q/BCP